MLFFLITFNAKLVFPASIAVVRAISFGEIIAGPTGDVVEIDARLGPDEDVSVLTQGNSITKDGYSGLIRVVSDTPGQTIYITYPASIALTADGFPDMIIDGMSSCSKTYAVSTMVGDIIDFDIGGRLHISSGLSGNAQYSNTITIDVDIINP